MMILDTLQKWFFVVVSLLFFATCPFLSLSLLHCVQSAPGSTFLVIVVVVFSFYTFAFMIRMNSYTSLFDMHKCKRFIYSNNLLMMRSYVCNPLVPHHHLLLLLLQQQFICSDKESDPHSWLHRYSIHSHVLANRPFYYCWFHFFVHGIVVCTDCVWQAHVHTQRYIAYHQFPSVCLSFDYFWSVYRFP